MRYSSCYVTMRDGVRIAIDLYLPAGLTSAARLPAILHQTRYYRSLQLRWPLRMLLGGKPLQHIAADKRRRRRFVASGYAWVDVDVRGSGASFGARVCEWSSDEIRDGAEIVDWIVRQPWCNGTVAALGNSYDGTSAELLLVNQHPAVRVIAPCFSLFDVYTDIAFPGGIHAAWFTDTWGRYNEALDRNALHEVVGWWAKLPVTGMQPVQEDRDRSLRDGAIAAHRGNYDVHQIAGSLTFRDDVSASDPYRGQPDARLEPIGTPIESGSINLISPHNYWRDVQASGAAIYSYSGWFDGGYAHAAIKRFLTVSTPGSHLILGPWNHTGGWRVDPLRGLSRPDFDHDGELLRFIDHHVRGPIRASAPSRRCTTSPWSRTAGSRPTPGRRPPPRRATTCPQTDSCARTHPIATAVQTNTWWIRRPERASAHAGARKWASVDTFATRTARPRMPSC